MGENVTAGKRGHPEYSPSSTHVSESGSPANILDVPFSVPPLFVPRRVRRGVVSQKNPEARQGGGPRGMMAQIADDDGEPLRARHARAPGLPVGRIVGRQQDA